ncbi:hypothetical protein JVT61DRAFT_12281 [Boletus reticuloceps]|uniref:Uncharacterized protein n=1 Tax=Boletus reticuloceps TaxID=495285 RepID=A0A8I3A3C3_9AGAM|nr:hypothetical protein JVT61DRAFT_12281 [Boletus reticuloceps]
MSSQFIATWVHAWLTWLARIVLFSAALAVQIFRPKELATAVTLSFELLVTSFVIGVEGDADVL